jgi:hypothetical protein
VSCARLYITVVSMECEHYLKLNGEGGAKVIKFQMIYPWYSFSSMWCARSFPGSNSGRCFLVSIEPGTLPRSYHSIIR